MQVSVRQLCEFAARSGSLDHRYSPSPTAREGIIGHQWLQSQYPDFNAEHPIEGYVLLPYADASVALKGRADLFKPAHEDQAARLIEIKTFRGRPERINPGQQAQHWAQLEVYGALICQRDQLDHIELTLIYMDVDSKQRHEITDVMTADQLMTDVVRWSDIWYRWQQQELAHRQKRDLELQQLTFLPSGFRAGQRELSENVFKAISRQARLLLEAPTGLGKTLGVLFPALKAMPIKQIDRLFFLTARTTGRQLALDSLEKLTNQQPPMRVLELIAKEKSCEYPESACHGESCPLANDFFERLPAARQQAANTLWLDSSQTKRIAAEHRICPYYLAQEMARWSDLIIGDVNHYFDDSALLHALTVEHQWRSVVMVDEAHNLIDRARSMYSTRLEQAAFDDLRKKSSSKHGLRTAILAVQKGWQDLDNRMFPELINQTQFESEFDDSIAKEDNGIKSRFSDELPEDLTQPVNQLASSLAKALADTPDDQLLQQALFDCLGFLRRAETWGEHSVVEIGRTESDTGQLWASTELDLTIHNLIPADFLRPRFESAEAVVLFSATLQPSEYYRDMLGLPADTRSLQTSGPFRREQIRLSIPPIDTRFHRREDSIAGLAKYLVDNHHKRGGNHLVFFSSFSYLQSVSKAVYEINKDLRQHKQKRTMTERQRQTFIAKFRQQRGLLGMAVLGGVFSEGIDLPGDELISVSVVTLGQPPNDRLHKILEQRIKQRFGDENGRNYTWLYPGMRKVVQAAGRLIRTPDDSGWIDLIDPRFDRPDVRALLPQWWFEQ